MKRIIWHWTAGTHNVSDLDRKHYHFIIDGEGTVHDGYYLPEANRSTRDGHYAAHTRALNTGSIGVAVAAMANAQERPFNAGRYPITEAQIEALALLSADLGKTYNIPVKRNTMLSHAEVQPTLGVKQRGKWDITWLPDMPHPSSPIVVGDKLRKMVSKENAAPVTNSLFQRILRWLGLIK